MAVSPGEEGHCRQTADDDDLQDEDGRPHDPVEGDDARAVVLAHVAAFRTLQTLVLVLVVVHALHALHESDNISVALPLKRHANEFQFANEACNVSSWHLVARLKRGQSKCKFSQVTFHSFISRT